MMIVCGVYGSTYAGRGPDRRPDWRAGRRRRLSARRPEHVVENIHAWDEEVLGILMPPDRTGEPSSPCPEARVSSTDWDSSLLLLLQQWQSCDWRRWRSLWSQKKKKPWNGPGRSQGRRSANLADDQATSSIRRLLAGQDSPCLLQATTTCAPVTQLTLQSWSMPVADGARSPIKHHVPEISDPAGALQRQTALTAYLKSNQLLLFVFAVQYWPPDASIAVVKLRPSLTTYQYHRRPINAVLYRAHIAESDDKAILCRQLCYKGQMDHVWGTKYSILISIQMSSVHTMTLSC